MNPDSPEIKNDKPQPLAPQVGTPSPATPAVQPAQPVNSLVIPTELNSAQERPSAQGGIVVSGGIDPPPLPKPDKKRRLIYVIAGVILAIILITSGIYLATKGNSKAPASKTTPKASSAKQKSQSSGQAQTAADSQALADLKRKSSLDDLSSLLNAYASTRGKFPMLSELNDPPFRTEKLPQLDDSLLQDPDATQPVLVTAPTKGAYSYQVTDRDGKACVNQSTTRATPNGPFICTKYTLTATLSDGTTFTKTGEAP